MTLALLETLFKAAGFFWFAVAAIALWEFFRAGRPLPFFGEPGEGKPWWK